MDIFWSSVMLQIILFVYFEVTMLVDLFPWNDLSKYTHKERFFEATVNGGIILVSIALFVTNIKWLMIISVVFWFLFLLMQLINWWVPYVTGKHVKQFPRELYDTHFQETLKILPPIKHHIIPDVQHNVLQLLSLAVFILSLMTVMT